MASSEPAEDFELRDKRRLAIEEAVLSFANAVITFTGLGLVVGATAQHFDAIVSRGPIGTNILLILGLLAMLIIAGIVGSSVVPAKFARLLLLLLPETLPRSRWLFYPFLAIAVILAFAMMLTVLGAMDAVLDQAKIGGG